MPIDPFSVAVVQIAQDTSLPGGRDGAQTMKWSDLTMTPDDDAVAALRTSWRWRLGDEWSPLMFSIWGDVFLKTTHDVRWLNTGTGDLTPVASDEDAFRQALGSELATDWFLPPLVEALHRSGKRPGAGECFTYAIYPVFAEGKYEVENFAVVPAKEHFGLSGDFHREIAGLQDGDKVRLIVGPK